MRILFTTILFAGIMYLSACSSKDDSTNSSLLIIPSADSVTKNSAITLYFENDTFAIHDLTVQNLPVEYLFSSDIYNPNDSFWVARVVLSDYLKKQISLNLTANNTSTTAIGLYYVTSNSSTFTDYSHGDTKVYSILNGGTINVTNSTYPISGTLDLSLYYNNDTIPLTGDFQIYQ